MITTSILIVSEDLSHSTGLETNLHRYTQECQVVLATTGLAALKRLQERAFDIILADWRLPHMTGLELAMAASQDSPQATVILMAGHSDTEGRAGGADTPNVRSVLTRPLSIAQLWSIVQTNRARQAG